MRIKISLMLLACVLLAIFFSETVEAKKHEKDGKGEKTKEVKYKEKEKYNKKHEKYNNEGREQKYSKEAKNAKDLERNSKDKKYNKEKSKKENNAEKKAKYEKVKDTSASTEKKLEKPKEETKEEAKRDKRSVPEEQLVVVEEVVQPAVESPEAAKVVAEAKNEVALDNKVEKIEEKLGEPVKTETEVIKDAQEKL